MSPPASKSVPASESAPGFRPVALDPPPGSGPDSSPGSSSRPSPGSGPSSGLGSGLGSGPGPGAIGTPALARPAGPAELFVTFARLALQGFGGVLPWVHRVLVERKGWLSREDFGELLALGQLLPGPNVCNVAVMVGDRFHGWRGAIAALSGMVLVPALLVLSIAILVGQFATLPQVRQALGGMAAVAAGLVIAMSLKLAIGYGRRWPWLAFGLAAFLAVGVMRWPLAWVLAVLAPTAIAAAWMADVLRAGRR